MRLATPGGELVDVRKRSWPLAGTNWNNEWSQGSNMIRLTQGANGGSNGLTYSQIYKTNPWVYACVQAIARGLSSIELQTLQEDAEGNISLVNSALPASPGRPHAGLALDKMMKHPNPTQGGKKLRRSLLVDELIYGNALMIKERDSNNRVVELWRAPWKKVTVVEGDSIPILHYEYRNMKSTKIFMPEDVVHFSTADDPDSPIGVSPIQPLKWTIALFEAMQQHLAYYFQNMARPSGNLKLEKGTNKDSMAVIREQVKELYSSPENAGRVMVTTGDWQSITADMQQAGIVELIKLSRDEIAAAFRIPPPVLGILERAIHSNVVELREQYIRDAVGTWAAPFIEDLMDQLIYPDNGFRPFSVAFNFDDALAPDLEARAKSYVDLQSTLTTNDRRKKEGLPPLPYEEADTVYLPAGSIALGITPADPYAMGQTVAQTTQH